MTKKMMTVTEAALEWSTDKRPCSAARVIVMCNERGATFGAVYTRWSDPGKRKQGTWRIPVGTLDPRHKSPGRPRKANQGRVVVNAWAEDCKAISRAPGVALGAVKYRNGRQK